jgi:hypothetical protein
MKAEFQQQFIRDAFLTPCWILSRHPSDQLTEFFRNRRPPGSRFPPPPQAERNRSSRYHAEVPREGGAIRAAKTRSMTGRSCAFHKEGPSALAQGVQPKKPQMLSAIICIGAGCRVSRHASPRSTTDSLAFADSDMRVISFVLFLQWHGQVTIARANGGASIRRATRSLRH